LIIYKKPSYIARLFNLGGVMLKIGDLILGHDDLYGKVVGFVIISDFVVAKVEITSNVYEYWFY